MKQAAYALLFAFVLIGFSTRGFLGRSGRAFADDPPKKAVAKKAEKAVPAAGPVGVNQFEAQIKAQLTPLYKMELHFMRTVCQPTRQQFERISADGEAVLPQMIKDLAAAIRVPQLRPGRPVEEQPEPRTVIAGALAKSVQKTLSTEQAARYQKELDLRAAARKRVTVLSLILKADRILILSPEQRDKLGKILEKDWKDTLYQSQMLMFGDYFPVMPNIDPILTETQKSIWAGIPKGTVRFGFNLGLMQNVEVEEESWDEEGPVTKPGPAADKAAVKDKGAARPVEKK
jgi:hypothetical protein